MGHCLDRHRASGCPGCAEGLLVWAAGRAAEARARRLLSPALGLERRYRRLEERERDVCSCSTAPVQKVQLEFSLRHRNVRICAKVSPSCRRFADAYELSSTILGTGMNGDVMLARHRCPVSASASADASSPGRGDSAASCSKAPPSGHGDSAASCSKASPCDREEPSRCHVAVKSLSKRGLAAAQLVRLWTEVDIYLRMDHMNVARLLQVFDEPEQVYLVMEYCSGGTLGDRQLEDGPLSEKQAALAMRQILSAVNYCHSHPRGKVCHGDLKHQNFVYASRAEGAPLKLVDFGLSQVLSTREPRSALCAGSLQYCAPEILLHRRHDQSCDMWSLGVIAYSLLSDHMPFDARNVSELTRSIAKGAAGLMTEREWEGVSDLGKDFVMQLMSVDPGRRPTAEVALHHPWLATAAPPGAESLADARPLQQATSPLSVSFRDVLEKMRLFAYESAARRASASLAVNSEGMVIDDSYSELETHFRDLDTDMSGTISVDEFAEALQQSLGVSPDESRFIFERLDTDGDGEIEYSEFLAAAVGKQLLHRDCLVRKAFEHLDTDNDGSIELRDLPKVLGRRFCGQPSESIFCDRRRLGGDGEPVQHLTLHSFEWIVKCHVDSHNDLTELAPPSTPPSTQPT